MKRIVGRLIGLLLIGPLIAACSLGSEPAESSQPQSRPTARPVAMQADASIDGRLLFVQDGNLYLHQGQTTRQMTRDGTTRDPAWSPDGRRIAYVRRDESFSDIYLLDVSGGLPTQITFNRGQSQPWTQEFMHEVVWAAAPTWTPDGKQIVFLSQVAPPTVSPPAEYPLSIYQYPISLIGTRQPTNDDLLLRADESDFQRSTWASDESALAYTRVPRGAEPKQIMLYDPNTGESSAYPGIPDNAYDPAWSPDARWLAFAAIVDGKTDIWAIPHLSLGGSAVRLTAAGSARAPAWSPDGKQLAYVQLGDEGADVYVLTLKDASGTLSPGESRALTHNGQIDANSGLSWGK
ncbi:MAG TPA: DPP IV N-terminal domain-containing protein [Herpetosiphonaceae bacterium]